MKKLLVLVVIAVLLIFSCTHNEYSPENISGDVDMSYTVSYVNDTLNAYCFYPVEVGVIVESGKKYVDSVLVKAQNMGSFERIDNRGYRTNVVFDAVGKYEIRVRTYLMDDGGRYRDTVLFVNIGMDYEGVLVNEVLSGLESYVDLKAVGHKADGVMWEWDLRRVGGGVITSVGDTVFWVEQEYNDTVFLRQVDAGGRKSADVAVPFMTRFRGIGDISVPFLVSLFEHRDHDTYCFFPIKFVASPNEADLRVLSKIELFVSGNFIEKPVVLSADSGFEVVFSYSDTGVYNCIVRVHEIGGGVGAYRDTGFTVRVGLGYGGERVSGVLIENQITVNLTALGDIAEGVYWEWDLTKIGLGKRVSESRVVPIDVDRVINDTVFIAQVDSATGRRSPRVAVPFVVGNLKAGEVPFTISRNSAGYNAFCLSPVTFTANPRVADRGIIDSIVLKFTNDLDNQLVKLNGNYEATIDFALAGKHVGVMNVYSLGDTVSQKTNFEVFIGADYYPGEVSVRAESRVVSLNLTANGTLANGALWRWVLPDSSIVVSAKDTTIRLTLKNYDSLRCGGLDEKIMLTQVKQGRISSAVSNSYRVIPVMEVVVHAPFNYDSLVFNTDSTFYIVDYSSTRVTSGLLDSVYFKGIRRYGVGVGDRGIVLSVNNSVSISGRFVMRAGSNLLVGGDEGVIRVVESVRFGGRYNYSLQIPYEPDMFSYIYSNGHPTLSLTEKGSQFWNNFGYVDLILTMESGCKFRIVIDYTDNAYMIPSFCGWTDVDGESVCYGADNTNGGNAWKEMMNNLGLNASLILPDN